MINYFYQENTEVAEDSGEEQVVDELMDGVALLF